MNQFTNTSSIKNALSEAEIDELIEMLDDLSEHFDTISLEGLDGCAAACAVMLRPVTVQEVYATWIDSAEDSVQTNVLTAAQWARLEFLWAKRVNHTSRLLSHAELNDLSDPRAYHPWVIDYVNAAQTDPELAQAIADGEIPELAQEWALGFISTVEHFSVDWRLEDELLDDELNPMLSPFYALATPKEEWPEDIVLNEVLGDSREAWFAQAIWACYELWEYWRLHAPRPKGVTVVKQAEPGRNDPCHCGSGKKFKLCHGQ